MTDRQELATDVEQPLSELRASNAFHTLSQAPPVLNAEMAI